MCIRVTREEARLAWRTTKARGKPGGTAPGRAIAIGWFGLAGLWMLVGAKPATVEAIDYELKVIAVAGQAGLTGMEKEVSINNAGMIAFIGQLQNSSTSFEDVFVGSDEPSGPVNISNFSGPDRNFGNGVQLTDANTVAARDQVSGAPPQSFVRVWGPSPGVYDVIAQGGGGLLDDYDTVFVRPSVNNDGDVVFCALEDGIFKLVTPITPIGGFFELEVNAALRPMIADNESIVARSGGSNTFPISVYNYNLLSLTDVSGNLNGLGSFPGISDSGKLVVFFGDPGTGAALYLSYSTDGMSFSPPVRITGPSGDGEFDPGETWSDSNGNNQVDPGEDSQGFSPFNVETRVTVNSTHDTKKSVTVCYQATKNGTLGIYTSRVEIDLTQNPVVPLPQAPSKVAAVGDTVGPHKLTILDLAVYDSINDDGQIGFWANTSGGNVVGRAEPLRNPVIIVPGIAGTLVDPSDSDAYKEWLTNRGVPADTLELDPLTHAYDDLIATLTHPNVNYVLDNDLFVCKYDWRMPPGPFDGQIDGTINGVAVAMADGSLLYGVNYLGQSLLEAAAKRKQLHPTAPPLTEVDIISHSTGGLVTRVYIQSDAYGESFVGPGGEQLNLPKIGHFFMLGVPNRGASAAWNVMHDNWISEPAYKWVLSKIVLTAYKKVLDGMGISGPDYNINLETLQQGECSPVADIPPGYYDSVDASNPVTLRATLHDTIDDHVRVPYTCTLPLTPECVASGGVDTWQILEDADEVRAGGTGTCLPDTKNFLDVYRNECFPKLGGENTLYQREHTWPKSYGFPKENASNIPYSDCHMLHLSDASYNAARGNRLYRTCTAQCCVDAPPDTDCEYVTSVNNGQGGGSGVYPGNSNWGTGSGTQGTWQTWIGKRGNVARAILYMDIRYEGGTYRDTGVWEPDLIVTDIEADIAASNTGDNEMVAYMGMLSTLLHWHAADPVDDDERYRNDVVYLFQENRNPFVDHPEWVNCLWGEVNDRFINDYVPTLRSLLATYAFLSPNDQEQDLSDVNGELDQRNSLLLDLNAGYDCGECPLPGDPAHFANLCEAVVIPGTGVATKTYVTTHEGPEDNVLWPMAAWFPFLNPITNAAPGQKYFKEVVVPANGDGTVPIESATGLFGGPLEPPDPRVQIRLFPEVEHLDLSSDPAVQLSILATLGENSDNVSTGLQKHWSAIPDVLNVIFQSLIGGPSPGQGFEGFLVDGAGRRLGWSAATGPVTEIPESVWFGDSDGIGWVLGPVPQPMELHLTGLGGDYYVQCSFEQGGVAGGAEASGFLAVGEQLTIPVGSPPDDPPCRADCDDDNPCTDDSCDPDGICVNVPNSEPCDDGDACTTKDTCAGGGCVGGREHDCDDDNPCTDDSCDPDAGCVNVPNSEPCDDGDVCTTKDICAGGSCAGGPAPDCDDDNPCTDDSCDPDAGCVNVPNSEPCDDGDACTTKDACTGGGCVGGREHECDDDNPCTVDSCDRLTGCVSSPIECPAGQKCVEGECVLEANVMVAGPRCSVRYWRDGIGFMRVVLLGSENLAVADVEVTSLLLRRADGMGGAVSPNDGPRGPKIVATDTARLHDQVGPCGCFIVTADGLDDLVLRFSNAELVTAMELNCLAAGEQVVLELIGTLADGTPFIGADCIIISGPPSGSCLAGQSGGE
jgi:endonuclease I